MCCSSRELGMIPFGAESVEDVPFIVGHRETAMREPEHPVAVSALAGQQASAGRRAGRIRIMRIAKDDALFR